MHSSAVFLQTSALVLRVGASHLAYAGFSIALILLLWMLWNMSRT